MQVGESIGACGADGGNQHGRRHRVAITGLLGAGNYFVYHDGYGR
jgi:hypothetical protein